jgi:N-acetylmuramoyl-L-alanine amidase
MKSGAILQDPSGAILKEPGGAALPRKKDSSVPRLLRGASILALALLCALSFRAAAYAQPGVEVEPSEARVALPEAARHFGATTSWEPDEWKLTLTYRASRAEILIGSDRLVVNDYLMTLSAPVKASGGSVTMAHADSAELFTRLLGRRVTEQEISAAGLLVPTGGQAAGENRIKSVRYVTYPRFTRIIINVSGAPGSEEIDVRPTEEPNTLTIELGRSRFVQPAETIEIGDRIIDVIEQAQVGSDARLIVRSAHEKIRYEIQRHDDPPRIVVDVSPSAPQIATEFLNGPDLPGRPGGWIEPVSIAPREKSPFTTIVIDPGHGGKDNGARGRGGLAEKDVALAIALKLKRFIEEKPGLKVVLTRTSDYFVPLKERTAIANHAKDGMPADLFISVHTNAHKSPKVGGFESFYISDAIDLDAEATAAFENAVVELETASEDPLQAALAPILWDLQFTEFVSESSAFASLAQKELAVRLTTRNRGVRQAKFIVLAGVAMPSILVEVGFISNLVEEAKLKTSDFRNKCASALAAAVSGFKKRRDVRLGLLRGESGR